jgi:hypothetical protein
MPHSVNPIYASQKCAQAVTFRLGQSNLMPFALASQSQCLSLSQSNLGFSQSHAPLGAKVNGTRP